LIVARKETAIDEVVAFDACERDRIGIGAKELDALGILLQRQGGSFPNAPGTRGLKLHLRIAMRQPAIVGFHHAAALVGRDDLHIGVESVGKEPAAPFLVEPVKLRTAQQEDPA
jgi:hypothetical protein